MRRALVAGLLLWLAPLTAAAQGGGVSQGPMTVEPIRSGILVAPDVKVTKVDRRTSEFVGGYAGWLADDRFFIGGAGYWMANHSRDREMAYGGLLVQWLVRSNERVGFSARGLVGGGQARLSNTVTAQLYDPRGNVTSSRFGFRQDFFVAEPEVNVLLKLTSRLRLTGGVGYRFVAVEGRDDNRLRGAAGSVGLQIGGGS